MAGAYGAVQQTDETVVKVVESDGFPAARDLPRVTITSPLSSSTPASTMRKKRFSAWSLMACGLASGALGALIAGVAVSSSMHAASRAHSLPPEHTHTVASSTEGLGVEERAAPRVMTLPMQAWEPGTAAPSSDQWRLDNCPWGKVELGRGAWPMLHSLGAEYPDDPTPEQQILAYTFIQGLAQFYPCHLCARHFQASIKINPPRTESRTALSEWFCEQHNEINSRQHKPLFNCTIESLDLRWRTGVPGCFDADHPYTEPGTV